MLHTYVQIVDAMSERLGRAISWLATVLVVVVCYDVFTRYFLKNSIVAVQELQWHLFAIIFLLAAPYTLKHDRHVRVDVLYTRFSPKTKAWINLLGSFVLLLPFAIITIYSSIDFVQNSFAVGETSPDPGGLPARYVLKAMIPISMFLLSLQAFSEAAKSWLEISGAQKSGEQ